MPREVILLNSMKNRTRRTEFLILSSIAVNLNNPVSAVMFITTELREMGEKSPFPFASDNESHLTGRSLPLASSSHKDDEPSNWSRYGILRN